MSSNKLTRAAIEEQLSKLKHEHSLFLKNLEGLSDECLSYQPDSNSWSILGVLEHLVLAEENISNFVEKSLNGGESYGQPSLKDKIMALVIRTVLASPAKVKVPTDLVVPKYEDNLDSLKKRWLDLEEKWARLLSPYPAEGNDQSVFKHPYSGPLNFRDTIRFLIAHIDHHELQRRRILDSYNSSNAG